MTDLDKAPGKAPGHTFIKILFLISILILFTHCGMDDGTGTRTGSRVGQFGGAPGCSPNIIDNGLRISMEPIYVGSNDYTVTLCTDAQPSDAIYTFYGGRDEGSLEVRLAGISGTTNSGASFQVSFKSSDTYFAAYLDQNGQTMISPHRLPGR
jgi:hypothetical protein